MKNAFRPKLRRLLALVLALLLTTALFGCQKKDDPGKTDGSEPPAQSDTAAVPTTTAPVETTEAPTTAPVETTQPEQDPVMGTVTATKLNIRNSDSFDAESVGFYYKDDRVEVLEIKGAWGRTEKGWVSLEYIKLDGSAVQDNGTDATEDKNTGNTDTEEKETVDEELVTDGKTKVLGNGVVTIGSLNVRSGPGTKYGVLTKFSLGNRYAYYQKSGNWVRTEKGWISLTYFYVEGNSGEGAGKGTVTASELNIRKGPGTGFDRAGKYEKGATIQIKAQVNGWGYTDKGWVSMEHVKMDGESTSTGSSTYKTGKGTVTANGGLNIRKEGKSDATVVGSYTKDAKIEILEVKGEWGRTDKGWVSMKYVKMDSGSGTTSSTTYKTGKGTVTANSGLNIRKEANTSSTVVGSYKKGDKVEILEVKGEWGRTDKGWVSLKYVKMD